MIAKVNVKVVPVWFIEKWTKENAQEGSALDFWCKQMLKDWELEEKRSATNDNVDCGMVTNFRLLGDI